jgi:hypothetical protein
LRSRADEFLQFLHAADGGCSDWREKVKEEEEEELYGSGNSHSLFTGMAIHCYPHTLEALMRAK